jgi:hypothetical protein
MALLNNTEWRMSRKGPFLMFVLVMIATILGGSIGGINGVAAAAITAAAGGAAIVGIGAVLWGIDAVSAFATFAMVAGSVFAGGLIASAIFTGAAAAITGAVAAVVLVFIVAYLKSSGS